MEMNQSNTINGFDLEQEREAMEAMRRQPETGAITIRTRHRWRSAAEIEGASDEIELADGPLERRHHRFHTDFPREMGGQDAGPAPGEMLMAALAGCIGSSYAASAAARGVGVDAMEIDINADVDLRGTYGIDSVPARPSEIAVTLRVRSDASRGELEALSEVSKRHSPVADSLLHPLALRLTVESMPGG
jgi:uncharacterized OsmC-like protein